MKRSRRRSYAFFSLVILEKGMTIKNEARFWSRKLGRKKKRKESKIFVRIFQFG